MGDTLFGKIIRREIPADIVFEDDDVLAFRDVNPQAPVHVLVLPVRHVDTFRSVGEFDAEEAKRMLEFVAEVARGAGLEDFRVIANAGAGAGQTILHLHWHVLGGRMAPFG